MNVLLIRPPDPLQHVNLLSHTRPMNLAYLAACLRRQGHLVTILDYETEQFSEQSFHRVLREKDVRLIGVSCVTPVILNGAHICSLAKQYDRKIVTVVGGPHASGLPRDTMRDFPMFDYLVSGEGEATFAELVGSIGFGAKTDTIRGIVFRDGDAVVQTGPRQLIEDLDSIPFPARDLIPMIPERGHSTRGFSNRLVSAELFTSRGCPFGCTYCAIQTTFGRSVRYRSVSFVEEELRQMMRDHHVNHIVVADDTFTLNPERALSLCDMFQRNGVRSWNCDTRVSGLSRDLLGIMKKSGCRKVAFGVESGSPRVLDLIGKRITIEQVEAAVHWAKDAGIEHIEGNFIIGSDPSETFEDIELTREAIRRLPWTFVSVAIIVPYPGTPVEKKMRAQGLIPADAGWEDYVMFGVPPKWRTEYLTSHDLIRLQKKLTREFYLNPAYIMKRLSGIRSLEEIAYWFSAGAAYLKWHFAGRL